MNKMDEKILVVDRGYLFENEALVFQGILTEPVKVKRIMKKFDEYSEVRRGNAEDNKFLKQPIPSVIIRRGDEVFLYKRLSGGGEARLHDQLSISVGGHMNRINDVHSWDSNLMMNLRREIHEEVEIVTDGDPELELIGLINDDSNEVGRVHIGILFMMDLPEDSEVTVRETDQLEGCWVRIKDLNKSPLFECLESWSQFSVDVLSNAKEKQTL